MKRQAMTVTPNQLQKLKTSLIHQQQELQKELGIKDWQVVSSDLKFQINIINKTPKQCDTWEIEK